MAEQAALVGLPEGRAGGRAPASGRRRAGAPPRGAGRRAAADAAAPSRGRSSRRRPCARAGRRRRSGASRPRAAGAAPRARVVRENRARSRRKPGCAISAARNSRKPSSSSASRRSAGGKRRRIGVRRGLERAHVELQAVAELLDPSEHAHRVALREARVEQLDVVPHARVDPPARVDELEREVGRAAARAQPLLARDGVDAFDDPLLGELRDRAHGPRI